MRRQSLKTQKLYRHWRSRRLEFVRGKTCMCCGLQMATCCHEIARGTHRQAAFVERATWLAVCMMCNNFLLTDDATYPLPRQLALKWIYDREFFSLEKFNLLRGRAVNAITWTEVLPFICREEDARDEKA